MSKLKVSLNFAVTDKFRGLFTFLLDAEKENLKLIARLGKVESNDRMTKNYQQEVQHMVE